MLILSVILASAEYVCDDDSDLNKDRKEIREFDRKNINGIGIALLEADEFSALGGVAAKIIVDAKKISLSNETPSEDLEISGSDHTITLINATNNYAKIKVDGSSDIVEEGDVDTIGGLKVILAKSDSGIGIGNVDVIVGIEEISLSSSASLFQLFKIKDKEYLAELKSASDTDATISVSKCNTGNLIEEIDEVVEENVEENKTEEINETIEETNITEVNIIKDEVGEVGGVDTKKDGEKSNLTSIIMIILIVIIVIIIIVFLLKGKKSKNYQVQTIN
tara:strand:+ start:41 stop:874 length:834 start_codon:yes stop_codon:yes gene_type:complete